MFIILEFIYLYLYLYLTFIIHINLHVMVMGTDGNIYLVLSTMRVTVVIILVMLGFFIWSMCSLGHGLIVRICILVVLAVNPCCCICKFVTYQHQTQQKLAQPSPQQSHNSSSPFNPHSYKHPPYQFKPLK